LILLVAPDPKEIEMLQRSLDGYALTPVASFEQAKKLAQQLFPRAILISGDEGDFIQENLPYDLPVIRYSISRSVSLTENLHARLVKPISRQALIQAIQSLGPNINHLLIVDDDPAMSRFVGQSFRAVDAKNDSGEYTLLSAFSGAEGLDILEKNPVDAVLLDLELPDMHGFDWLSKVRSRDEADQIPVIIISAEDIPADKVTTAAKVLELALHRPLMVRELGSLVKSVVENVLPQYPPEKQ
jgi:CheY-like chemotaxis protein